MNRRVLWVLAALPLLLLLAFWAVPGESPGVDARTGAPELVVAGCGMWLCISALLVAASLTLAIPLLLTRPARRPPPPPNFDAAERRDTLPR